MMQKTAGPQLNQAREDFNNRVSKKSMLGKSKKIQWESKRRFCNI
jgi:hypothetical protein|tara:strand:- start:975 stop:1109 length:135 start_codon:yes stop_codon:yes gene_type:complete